MRHITSFRPGSLTARRSRVVGIGVALAYRQYAERTIPRPPVDVSDA